MYSNECSNPVMHPCAKAENSLQLDWAPRLEFNNPIHVPCTLNFRPAIILADRFSHLLLWFFILALSLVIFL